MREGWPAKMLKPDKTHKLHKLKNKFSLIKVEEIVKKCFFCKIIMSILYLSVMTKKIMIEIKYSNKIILNNFYLLKIVFYFILKIICQKYSKY
jgi:hypothetical protein